MTEARDRALAAVKKHGSIRGAARALGFHHETVRQHVRRAQKDELEALSPPGKPFPGMYPHSISEGPSGTSVKYRLEEVEPSAAIPQDFSLKRISQLTDGSGREILRWNIANRNLEDQFKAFKQAMVGHSKRYRGLAGTVSLELKQLSLLQDYLTVYAIGDAHCGMVSWKPETGKDFDLKIWRTQLQRAHELLMLQTPDTDRCTIFNAGDWNHVESEKFETPAHHNRLDADTRIGKIARVSMDAMRWLIAQCLKKHRHVSVAYVRGNHDPNLSMFMNMWLQDIYADEPRVSIPDNFAVMAYEQFGKNLLGYTHGNACPLEQLPGIMATDQREIWSQVKHCMWLTCHVHHKKQLKLKEYPGVIVESFSSLVPRDGYAASKMYRSQQGMEALLFHKEHGLKSRHYVRIDEVEEKS